VPEIFYVSKNAMRRCTGPVSIYVQCPSAPGGYSLNIFNTAGELVRKLGSGHLQIPLVQSYLWDGTNKYGELCASGVYIVSLNDPLDYKTKRILLIR
jgi:flagellar hook assembly protein FlgD